MTSTRIDGIIDLEPATPTVGSFVNAVDLADEQSEEVMRAIEWALHERGVLFFRNQHRLTPETQKRFASWFGTLWIHPFAPNIGGDNPEVLLLDESGGVDSIGWHTDGVFDERPALGCVLRAVDLPANGGGDTIWSSMVAAYEALSAPMQRLVESLHAVQDTAKIITRIEKQGKTMQRATHPVVVRDPLTGKRGLFVNQLYTTRIVELRKHESEAVLHLLFDHITSPNFQVRLKWEPGTVVFWNNLLTQHFPTNDYKGEVRTMHRVTINGDVRPEQ